MIDDLQDFTPPPSAPRRTRGRAPWIIAVSLLGVALLATTTLASYLWLVSSQWTSQNDELRAEATELGSELGLAQSQVATLEEQVTTLDGQLDATTERLSDLANEEAHAGDDVEYLSDLIEAYESCIANYDETLSDALRNGYTYSNSNARSVQNDVADYCDSLSEAFDEFVADAG
ncbi:hypothetical protein [Demequina zhanjiangensis]|uniref:Uncharacterized protein n=1 Tax=Demequina zhanjiangensis TaxID=3051659 RepID=A0ABT8G3H9_9MICO|nr:hypothetical protein [Demequina sp. SYSU T00b26]MDN4473698.1 hypothetical protein [Demequina sp. SYSU T00b26]